MEDCYYDDCREYAVTPVLMAPGYTTKCCEDPPMCYPCLPRCSQGQMAYGYDNKPKKPPKSLNENFIKVECNKCPNQRQRCLTPPRQRKQSPPPPRHYSNLNCSQPKSDCCPTCYQSSYNPVKTKYVIPCYRYEDGRIEQYVPTRSGRLPMSAYRRNGMQDQIHGYKGAIRYLCAGESLHGCCVYTAVEPLRRIYPKNQPSILMNRACEVAVGVRSRRKPFIESTYRADSSNEIHRYHTEDEQGNCCYHFERKIPSSCCPLPKPYYPCQPCTSSPQCQYVDCVHARPVDSPNCCFYC